MGFNTNFLLSCLLIMLAVPLTVNSMVFKVGDAAGWSAQSHFDYTWWEHRPYFLIGDGLLFIYNPNTTDVLEVTSPDYKSCNPTSPLATYNTGNDTILLTEIGHRYFIGGNPIDCNNGLKLDIKVRNDSYYRAVRACPGCDNTELLYKPQCCKCPGCDDPLLPRLQCCDKNTSTGGATTTPTTSPTSTGTAVSAPTMSPETTSAGGQATSTLVMSPNSTLAEGPAASTPTMPPNSTTSSLKHTSSSASKFSWTILIVVAALVVPY